MSDKNMIKFMREVADALNKYADLMEKQDYTEQEFDEANKDLLWALAKLSTIE